MLEQIDELQEQATAELEQVREPEALEQWRIKYIGSKGAVKDLMGKIRQVPPDQRPEFGKKANAARQAIEQALTGLGTGEPGPAIDAAAQLEKAFKAEALASTALEAAITGRLTRVPGSAGQQADALDALLLKWRAAETRFRMKVEAALAAVREIAQGNADAERLGTLQREGNLLRSLHQSLLDQFSGFAADFGEGSLSTENQAAGDVLRTSERIAGLLLQHGRGDDREEALQLLSDVEGAAETWIASFAAPFRTARVHLEAARELVSAESVDAPAVRSELERARSLLREILTGLTAADAEPAVARMASRVGPLIDADVRHVRQRLGDLADHAHEEAVLAALNPLREQVDAPRADTGYAWAALVHRMLRSPLYQSGGTRLPPPPQEDSAFLKFLERELSEARQQSDLELYGEATREYLELVNDYLRY